MRHRRLRFARVKYRLVYALALVFFVGLSVLFIVLFMSSSRQKVVPLENSVYWGVLISGVPYDMAKLETFERQANKRVSIVHWGQPWWHDGGYQHFPTAEVEKVRAHGAIPMVDWSSWDYCCGPDQPEFQLANIDRGNHDAYIRQWATDAKTWGHPFFLRLDHEMNGWWRFPWSERLNGNQPGDFVKAWRHVHDIFTEVGATNVTWVWSPNIVNPETIPLESLYPGDDYVDWLGMDGYNWGTDRGNRWQTFAQVFGGSDYNGYNNTYAQLQQLSPSKPIVIAEFASSEDGGPRGRPASKAAWITDALQTQVPHKFPKVKAIVWFNWNDDDPELDWPIESSQASIAAFAAAIASDYYAASQSGAPPIEAGSEVRTTDFVPSSLNSSTPVAANPATATPTTSATSITAATTMVVPTDMPIPTSTPTPTPGTTSTSVATTTTSPPATPAGASTNLAPVGTGYCWWGLTSATSNDNRTLCPGVNDNNPTADVELHNGSDDDIGAYEGAGVIWSTARNISTVNYLNGSYDQYNKGVFTANLTLQVTTDGVMWTDTSWSANPAYAYDSAAAANVTYTFNGPTLTGVMGVRVVGQVRTSNDSRSWHAHAAELQAFN